MPQRSLERVRVLLVDDDEDASALLGLCLEKEGARVEHRSSARAALEWLSAEPADVLVADLGLGAEDGFWLVTKLLELGLAKPACIALTGQSDDSAQAQARQAGFDRFFRKPVDRTALISEIVALRGSRH